MEGTVRLPSPGELVALRYLWEHGTVRPRALGAAVYATKRKPGDYAATVLDHLVDKGLAVRSPVQYGGPGSCYSASLTPRHFLKRLTEGTWN